MQLSLNWQMHLTMRPATSRAGVLTTWTRNHGVLTGLIDELIGEAERISAEVHGVTVRQLLMNISALVHNWCAIDLVDCFPVSQRNR
jgi:hypothetical protein